MSDKSSSTDSTMGKCMEFPDSPPPGPLDRSTRALFKKALRRVRRMIQLYRDMQDELEENIERMKRLEEDLKDAGLKRKRRGTHSPPSD